MKKIALILLFLASVLLLTVSRAEAKWWVFGQAKDEINFNYLYLNNSSYEEMGNKVILYKDALPNGMITIKGKVSVKKNNIGYVKISKDNKQTWDKATISNNNSFVYNFAPEIGVKYNLNIEASNTMGQINNVDETSKEVVVVNEDIRDKVTESLNNLLKAYENEETNLFMNYVSPNFTGDEVVLNSAIRKDFNAFDLIKINYFINNITTSQSGKTFVSISYQRTVVSTKSGNTYSDNGNTELIFSNEDGKPKLFSMKNPLIFGLSDAGNVATGTIQSTNNNPIILVDSSGNVDEKPFRTAIDVINDSADLNDEDNSANDYESGNFTLVSHGFAATQGFTFSSETVESNAGNFEIEYNIFILPAGVEMYEIGVCSLNSVTSVNTNGYTPGPGAPGFAADASSVGKCYALKIGTKYAVIRVNSYSDAAGPPSTIQFGYKYQPDGSTNF